MSTIGTADALRVQVDGDGPDLVMIHGWTFHGGAFDELAAALGRHFRTWRVDLPGHGSSPMPPGGFDLDQAATMVAAVVPRRALWLGWSIGGMVALRAALADPGNVRALILVASSPCFVRTDGWNGAMRREVLADYGARLHRDYPSTLREFLAMQATGDEAGRTRVTGLAPRLLASPPHPDAVLAGLAILEQTDLRAASATLACPTLLVNGDRDSLAPASLGADWRRHCPRLETVTVAGAAHVPFASHPRPFIDAVLPFLRRHAAATGRSATAPARTTTRREEMAVDATAATNLTLPTEELERLYRTMVRIRRFDELVTELFNAGEVKGTAHSYVGEEAIAAAVGANLGERDYMASNHRGHGHCIAKGADPKRMMAELMGRESGYCGGLGGSMHIADLDLSILGANGIVGAAMPLSCGAALAEKLKGTGNVVVAFFGDGANNQGIFHESMNLASVWKLPMIFVCENNQYALTTSYRQTTAIDEVWKRAAAYSMPGIRVDGNDVAEVYHVAADAIARARAGEGPTLIEALTYRWGQHSMRANLRDPRPDEEFQAWMARDPVVRVVDRLHATGEVDEARTSAIAEEVERELQAAITFARGGTDPKVEQMMQAVYAPHVTPEPAPPPGDREIEFTTALNEALHQEMARDERVILMGEDVAETGGIFKVSAGLVGKFGPERVRDTPISEATFVGCGVGAAIAGLRPVVEIQIFDFITLTMDMLVNQAAKFRFMLGGKNTVPLVVRGPQGGGVRLAAQHSQSLEAWFTHVPGLVVVAPSTPYDAKGLLVSAIRDDNPVIFLETKLSYMTSRGPVPEALYALPIGKADIKRAGTDVTVIATLAMVPRALAAAEQLEREGLSVEVVDPRTLRPLDEETILASVRKTGRVLICHEAWTTGGFGAEVAAIISDKAFMDLDAPIRRVCGLDVPMPFHENLERAVIPSQERIVAAIRELAEF
ncbi:MAG: pimeloyl-ACP methyl ester esterase BioH [Ectothiorhodospiraceae bacterium]|nr:pimeloyl-ACP methyl ester esterase BioH [Chromatiales bacterium]MCP5153556.1 pimeloyl-ACP methyl ester esterase BioH [Ectothiorhodospiraceae bacterium]